jgi:NAD(P)-dependent dehydrogenase (short-subunit alcohol dehydrogenase family)
MTDFTGRKVVITGASGALGSGLATAFAAAGAEVVRVERGRPGAQAPAAGTGHEAVDLTSDAGVGDLFDRIGVPWAVINTVGGFAPRRSLTALDPAELSRQLTLNLVTAAIITKHALRVMQPAGAGRIIHTASRAATDTHGSGFAYSVSKLGVLHLVEMAAAEVAGTGLTVNSVVPSIMDTPANRAALPGADYDSWPKIPDIADAYLFLASPQTTLVNGAAIPVLRLATRRRGRNTLSARLAAAGRVVAGRGRRDDAAGRELRA